MATKETPKQKKDINNNNPSGKDDQKSKGIGGILDPFLKIKDQTLNIATWFSPTGETKSAHSLQDSKEAQNEVIQEISAQRKNTTIEDFTSELCEQSFEHALRCIYVPNPSTRKQNHAPDVHAVLTLDQYEILVNELILKTKEIKQTASAPLTFIAAVILFTDYMKECHTKYKDQKQNNEDNNDTKTVIKLPPKPKNTSNPFLQNLKTQPEQPQEEDNSLPLTLDQIRQKFVKVFQIELEKQNDPTLDLHHAEKYLNGFTQFINSVISNFEMLMAAHILRKSFSSAVQGKILDLTSTKIASIDPRVNATIDIKVRLLQTTEYVIAELNQRLLSLNHHPFYNVSTLHGAEPFQQWKTTEKKRLENEIAMLIAQNNHVSSLEYIYSWLNPYAWSYGTRKLKSVDDLKDIIGRVYVKVLEGRNLVLREKHPGPINPYCIVTCQKHSEYTHTVSHQLNPLWEQEFYFDVKDTHDGNWVEVDVWDNETLSTVQIWNSYFLGQVKVLLTDIRTQQPYERWFKLKERPHKKDTLVAGDILLTLLYIDFPTPAANKNLINVHQLYKILAYKLLEYENPESGIFAKGGQATIQDFSLDSKFILQEFSVRYGISELYKRLVHLSILCNHMIASTPEHLSAILELIKETMVHRMKVTPSDIENQMWSNIFDNVRVYCIANISRFKMVFPKNTPKGTLSMVIKLLRIVSDSDEESSAVLMSCVERQNSKTYDKLFYWNAETTRLCCDQYIQMCVGIIEDLREDKILFQAEFPQDFNLIEYSVEFYLQKLKKDVELLFTTLGNTAPTSEVFQLFFKLTDLLTLFERLTNKTGTDLLRIIPLYTYMKPYMIKWSSDITVQWKDWATKAVELDKWEVLSPRLMHSSSVVDLFASLHQSLQFLRALDWKPKSDLKTVLGDYVTGISQVIIFYFDNIQKSFIQDASNATFADTNSPQLKAVLTRLCVRLNNVESARSHLDDLSKELITVFTYQSRSHADRTESDFYLDETPNSPTRKNIDINDEEAFVNVLLHSTFKYMKDILNDTTDRLVVPIRTLFQDRLRALFKSKPVTATGKSIWNDFQSFFGTPPATPAPTAAPSPSTNAAEVMKGVDAIVVSLDNVLVHIHDSLYHPIFKKFLKKLWKSLMAILETMIMPNNPKNKLSPNEVQVIKMCLDPLTQLFVAGEVLNQDELKKDSSRISGLIDVYFEAAAQQQQKKV